MEELETNHTYHPFAADVTSSELIFIKLKSYAASGSIYLESSNLESTPAKLR